MELKKNKNKQVERYSGLFTEVGLLVALLVVFSAFKWKTTKPDYSLESPIDDEPPIEMPAPITKESEPKPIPPKPEPIENEINRPTPFINIVPVTETIPFDTSAINIDPTDIDIDQLFSSTGATEIDEPTPSYELSDQPSFPGGIEEYFKFLRTNIHYPEWERDYDIGGTVHLKFTIDQKGNVTDVVVVKGATENLNAEALRVAKMIPRWNPGMQNGRPVKCWFYQRIVFKTK